MPSRPCVLAALGAALVLPARIFAQTPVDPRADLEAVQMALDGAVAKVSRNGVSLVLGGADSCRGYHLRGLGAVFILAPRALPERLEGAAAPPMGRPGSVIIVHRQERIEGRTGAEQAHLGREDGYPAAEGRGERVQLGERDLRRFEAEAEALQEQAERDRQQAERELEAITREIQALRAGAQVPVPTPPAPPAWPPPPWRFWFRGPGPEDTRPPAQVISDVRVAVTDTLEGQAPHLRIVRPEESVVVAVDFVPGSPFLRPRPLRTLVVRVRKKELEERAAGKLAAEELHRRIEYVEY